MSYKHLFTRFYTFLYTYSYSGGKGRDDPQATKRPLQLFLIGCERRFALRRDKRHSKTPVGLCIRPKKTYNISIYDHKNINFASSQTDIIIVN